MEPITSLDDIFTVNLVVFDVDGVIVPRGTKIIETEDKINMDFKRPSDEFIENAHELLKYTNVAISSGRSMLTLKSQFVDLLGSSYDSNRFILQAENGGRITYGIKELDVRRNKNTFKKLQKLRKDLKKVKHDNIKGFEPKESIITIHCHDRVPDIESYAKDYPLYCLWNGEAYDIGDPKITKGSGLEKIKIQVDRDSNVPSSLCIAIGDRQNDFEMVSSADIGVSADRTVLKDADYYVDANNTHLPGEILADYLLNKFNEYGKDYTYRRYGRI